MGTCMEAIGDEGERIVLFGDFDPDKNDGEVTEEFKQLSAWVNAAPTDGETIDAELGKFIRDKFKEGERFRHGVKLFINEAIEELKKQTQMARDHISRPVSKYEDFAHGEDVGKYIGFSRSAQILADIVTAASLEIEKEG